MNFHLPMLKRVACGVAAAGMLSSCTLSSTETPQPTNQPIFAAPPATPAHVSGYVWDPEAFNYWFLACNPPGVDPSPCLPPGAPAGSPSPVPPVIVPATPGFANVTVQGADAQLFDPANPGPPPYALAAAQATAGDGVWTIGNVPSRPAPPYLPFAAPHPGVSPTIGNGPPFLKANMPIAPANYFPTITLQPIDTEYTDCRGLGAAMIGDSGYIQTVANFINANGGSTSPDGLVNGTGGVVVVDLTAPTGAPTFILSDGIQITADSFNLDGTVRNGTVYTIVWQPPGSGTAPPWQSDRGFFVADAAPTGTPIVMPMGLAVVVFDPPAGPPGPPVPTQVNFTFKDSLSGADPIQPDQLPPHPWAYPPVPPLMIVPHEVSFLNLPGLQPGGPPPPPFLCIPQGP